MAISERAPLPQPERTQLLDAVSVQALTDILSTLPIPVTIERSVDEQRETIFYRYQVGETTPEHPVGICMGATPDFLDALRVSLEAARTQGQSLILPRREYHL